MLRRIVEEAYFVNQRRHGHNRVLTELHFNELFKLSRTPSEKYLATECASLVNFEAP